MHCFNPSRKVKALKMKMERLHSKYVFVPVDKAANNVIIIRKRYFVDVLNGELNSTSTYVPSQLTNDRLILRNIDTLAKINVKIDKCEMPTFYWLPKLHKNSFISRFISNSSHCSTTILSKHITPALTAVKDHIIKYSETAFSNSNVNYFGPLKRLSMSSKSCDCVTFRDIKYLLPTFPLYTPHCHMISSKQKCFLLLTGVSTGSQKRTSVLLTKWVFLMENIYPQFEGMVYQQIVRIPMGTNRAPLIEDLFSFCYERDFMSYLHKSKQYNFIDMFNDTSHYLDDIFTIDNPEFEKHIPDIIISNGTSVEQSKYPRQRNFFPWFKYKVIGSDVHTSIYDKRDDFGFPIVNFPWLSGDVPRLPSYDVYIFQLVRVATCCTSISDFNSKNLQMTSELLTHGYRYHKLRKTFGKFFRSYCHLLSNFEEISFQEYGSEGISHPVFYGDLVYKQRRVKCETNFVSSGSKIVKRIRRRKYDPLFIKMTIGLVMGPSIALYRSFLEHCTLTDKAMGTLWRDVQTSSEWRSPDPRLLWLLVGTPLVLGHEFASSPAEHSLLWQMSLYFWYTVFITLHVCAILMASPL